MSGEKFIPFPGQVESVMESEQTVGAKGRLEREKNVSWHMHNSLARDDGKRGCIQGIFHAKSNKVKYLSTIHS